MGFHRNTKRVILFGSPYLGGFGFTDTFTDQGINQLNLFIGHSRLKGDMKKILRILVKNLQLVIGLEETPFQYPFARIERFCEHIWLTSLWKFIDSIDGTLHIEDPWLLRKQRVNDRFIMQAILTSNLNLPSKSLKRINACCLFLQVLTLTDICHGSGNTISVNILRGTRHEDRRSRYTWPNQSRPSENAWKIWNHTLRKVFC
jgi:hypothetical protein